MTNLFRADLHCHTLYSDGSDSPQELIAHAKKIGLSGLAITDHDTIEGVREALPASKELSLPLLSGVEFSASLREEPVHILAYGFPLNNLGIQHFCEKHRFRREDRNRKILKNLNRLGIRIEEKELENVQISVGTEPYPKRDRTIGRPHIAMLLIQKGVVNSIKEAFQKYLGEGKAAYDPGESVSVEETLDCIHKAKGFAILAHPHLINKRKLVADLLAMPFDGLEGYYANLYREQEEKWLKIAEGKNWIITGGSDYHGKTKPLNYLGSSWVKEETFQLLYTHFLSHEPLI